MAPKGQSLPSKVTKEEIENWAILLRNAFLA